MVILYGLGNNEAKYYNTKHNIGRKVIEKIAELKGASFSKNKSYYYTKSEDILMMYSAGYMNESGKPLAEFCRFTSLGDAPSLLVIHDDSDQIEGNTKLLPQGGSAGHHGIESIYREIPATPIAPENIWRLKVGIRPPLNKLRSETFVLSQMTKTDEESIEKTAQALLKSLPLMLKNDWSKAQTLLNVKSKPLN